MIKINSSSLKYHRIIRNRVMAVILTLGCFHVEAQDIKKDSLSCKDPENQRIENMIKSTNVVNFSGGDFGNDSINRILNRFYYDQFRHFQDPRAPYFMFMSRSGNLALGVGGVIRMRGYFDWNGSIPTSGFSPYFIPIPKSPTSDKELAATPAGTALYFTLIGHNSIFGDFMGYIEAGFSGYNNRDFKLKKAYIQAGNWTAGYATTTFEDTKAEPSTIDGSGPNGINSRTNVLLRYMHTFKNNHWTIAGSFEFPSSSISADGETTKACKDYIPDGAAFIQYQWLDGASHVRLSGLARGLTYRDMINEKNRTIMGWAAQLSGIIKVTKGLNINGIVSIGQGHESYTTDLAGGSFDLIPTPGLPGHLYAPTAVGYVFGATYFFSSKVFSNLALSQQRYYPKQNPGDSQYKYGLYGAVNLFWDITPRFEIGAEYLAGKRMNFNGDHGNANRLTAMMMLSF